MARPRKAIKLFETHAEIPLKNECVAVIDLVDVEKASKHGWILDDTKPNRYVLARVNNRTLRLHRYILDVPKGMAVDHIDGNGLNNRRTNLRVVTPQQNSFNRRKITSKSSRYKGVHARGNGKFRAAIRVNGKLINIGTFSTELDAAKAYNILALKYFGEFACLNQLL